MRISPKWTFFLGLLVFTMLSPHVLGEGAKAGKVIVTGQRPAIFIISDWLRADPLTDPTVVPIHGLMLSGEEIRRLIRLYFPRTYERLLGFEYIIMSQVDVTYFTDKQQFMLHDAIYDGGMGGMQTRSVMSIAAYIAHPWADSVLSDAFPNDADKVVSMAYACDGPMRVRINTNPEVPPIFKPYKDLPDVEFVWSGMYSSCVAIPKEGAVVVSYSVGDYPFAYPGMYPDPRFKAPGWLPHTMYWDYGNGTTWTHQDMIGGGDYWNANVHPYIPDMIVAEILFSTGRKLPDDVILVHRLRAKFKDYLSSKSFIFSILDFIDKFGANTMPIIQEAAEISDSASEARQSYLDQEYEISSNVMDRALEDIDLLRSKAMRLKARALLWIFIVEWLVVSGVSLVAGFTLWSLMVRRRLYREVRVTRLTSR